MVRVKIEGEIEIGGEIGRVRFQIESEIFFFLREDRE
jgi:hypothetical protein